MYSESFAHRPVRSFRHTISPAVLMACLVIAMPLPAADATSSSLSLSLSMEQRCACQRALEEVGWRHRIWPESNRQPRPPLEQVASQQVVAAKVERSLQLSLAQEVYWQRPITPQQLQAEIERMARHSRHPTVLRELWQALANDPHLVAECLARPLLAERLARSRYAFDNRIHGELRRQAEQELASLTINGTRSLLSGSYREVGLQRTAQAQEITTGDSGVVELGPEQWQAEIKRLAATFGTASQDWATTSKAPGESLPIGRFGPLREQRDRFTSLAVLEQTGDHLRLAFVAWPKQPFDSWWQQATGRLPKNLANTAASGNVSRDYWAGYQLPAIAAGLADQWSQTAWSPQVGRVDHTAVWTGTEMIIWGGWERNNGFRNTGSRYHPATDTWAVLSDAGDLEERGRHSAVWTGEEMIVWGGWDGEQYFNNGGRYDPAGDTWIPVSSAGAPSGRADHVAAWADTTMVVWGGTDSTGLRGDGGRYDAVGDLWSGVETTGAPAVRSNASAVWTGDLMIVWGGYGNDLLASGSRYDPVADTWAATASADAPDGRWRHSAVWTGDEMIIWGGWRAQGFTDSGARYDPAADSWTRLPEIDAPDPRARHRAIWTGNEMIIWGGWDGNPLGNGGRYDVAADSWSPTSDIGAPEAGYQHTAVWTGEEMITWGGVDAAGGPFPIDGGRYDPSTDSWVMTGQSLAPSQRSRHSAVWTGEEMIIWGGEDSEGFVNTGARYHLATDSWRPTSTTNVPAPRAAHSAIWTGEEMIVWGCVNDPGGRYDPVTDTWTGVNTLYSPNRRCNHSALWTGERMLIWGGTTSSAYCGNPVSGGGRYRPSTDGWTTINTTGAPVSKCGTRAVWASDEMLVWSSSSTGGGRWDAASNSWVDLSWVDAPETYGNLGEFSLLWTGDEMLLWNGTNRTGGRYDPDTDSWGPMNSQGSPDLRQFHQTVWTGDEMLIWGGKYYISGAWSPLASGGRYDSVADTWHPMTMSGAPFPRVFHSAVWAEIAMIVWGGKLPMTPEDKNTSPPLEGSTALRSSFPTALRAAARRPGAQRSSDWRMG